MAKGYWVASYRTQPDEETLAEYYPLATAAVEAGGGRFLIRGGRVTERESGLALRTTVVEYDSYEQAVKNYDSEEFKRARKVFKDAGVIRDFRIVEGQD